MVIVQNFDLYPMRKKMIVLMMMMMMITITMCKVFHGGEDSSQGLLACDTM
jgi:hypothetical protein